MWKRIQKRLQHPQTTAHQNQQLLNQQQKYLLVNKKYILINKNYIHRIKHITKKVTVSLCFRDSDTFVDKGTIRAKCYADFGMEQLLSEKSIKETNDNGFCKYTMMQKNPNLNYCYGIDWEFIK